MLPRQLTGVDPETERRRYKIVRCDTMADVPGLILSANIETGLCLLRQPNGASQEFNFGPDGLRIVVAAR
ncbi:MAG TPA: hypothetical protein VGM07_10785 [Stellaceae bacterium]|jgi:hypothetical protein